MIIVTGARGSIGQVLVDQLRRRGEYVVGLDYEEWDIRQTWSKWSNPMAEQSVFMKDWAPDIVYHLAAAKDAPEGETAPLKVADINIEGTANVLRRWPGARVILASTCKACDPETVYGASKLIAERLVLNAGGSVARFHNVRQTRGNVFETWRAIPADEPIPATMCKRYFIDIDQAVDLLIRVAELPPGRYLSDPGERQSMVDVARETYPDRVVRLMQRRRGDRLNEPLVASHERIESTDFLGILRVSSDHD